MNNISMNGFFEEKLVFFGLRGGLSLSFTDRILQNEAFDNIDSFFDEMLFLLEEFKNTRKHSCLISILENKTKNFKNKQSWKLISINSYNKVGVDKLGIFILGHAKRYFSECDSKNLGRINHIYLQSMLLQNSFYKF